MQQTEAPESRQTLSLSPSDCCVSNRITGHTVNSVNVITSTQSLMSPMGISTWEVPWPRVQLQPCDPSVTFVIYYWLKIRQHWVENNIYTHTRYWFTDNLSKHSHMNHMTLCMCFHIFTCDYTQTHNDEPTDFKSRIVCRRGIWELIYCDQYVQRMRMG